MIVLSENFRALFYAPFYAAYATGAFRDAGVEVALRPSPDPAAAGGSGDGRSVTSTPASRNAPVAYAA